jgi:hypothetical protein
MHMEVSNVQVTGSQAKVPLPKPRVEQSKPWRSAPSHCSPMPTMPSPQAVGPVVAESVPLSSVVEVDVDVDVEVEVEVEVEVDVPS